MRVPNPIALVFKGIWYAWYYTFGFVFAKVLMAVLRSDRGWAWIKRKSQAANLDPASLETIEAGRNAMLAGGATVITPAKGGSVIGMVTATVGICVCGVSGIAGSKEFYDHLVSCPAQVGAVEKSHAEQAAMLNEANIKASEHNPEATQ
jgi:hypothetical protein